MESNANERLVADLKAVIFDAEQLLQATAGEAGAKLGNVREHMGETLRQAKERLAAAEGRVVDSAKAAAKATDSYVHEHPWQSVGVAAALGLVFGVLIGRR
jgi:ElaB/YqjD/DUF883 family membrane-anchored ribosome-binding protein